MTTLAELVAQTPAATRGKPTGFDFGVAGEWRHVLELADPSAGAAVQWYDLTAIDNAFTGYDYARGSDGFQGRYRASVVTLDLYADDDRFAPWNDDTSATFGTHVELGPGLLLRSGFIRVSGGVVVEWLPRFTNRVEFWGDASYSRGKVRQHRVIARDTCTALVGVPLPAQPELNWSDRMFWFLTNSGWPFGSLIYGAQFLDGVGVLTLAARDATPSAIVELDQICDPTGLVWYTNRLGQLVVRPRVDDTFHADLFDAGATGDEYPGDVDPCTFTYWACAEPEPGDTDVDNAAYALDTPGVEPFGIDKSELSVVNHVKITYPAGGFDDDDPISIQRFDRHALQATWQAANDVVAAQLLTTRAFATREARPITTTSDLRKFYPDPARVDYLDYMGIVHRNSDTSLQCFANGYLRNYRERVLPRGCDTSWTLTISFDVFGSNSEPSLLPVVNLHLVDTTDTVASFAWELPTQMIEPTHVQIRMLNPASLWLTTDYPITDATWSGLPPATANTFQVRLVRIVDGVITDFSATRSVTFTTDEPTGAVIDPDDGTITFPDPDDPALCIIGWELQQSADGVTWTTIDSGNVTTPPYVIDYDADALPDEYFYRFKWREVCDLVPGPWQYTYFTVGCVPVARLDVAPYSDVDCVAFIPQICPDHIAEAFSDQHVTLGPAFDRADFDDDGVPVLVAFGAGTIGYGAQPAVVSTSSDLTIACRAKFGTMPTSERVLWNYGGIWLSLTPAGKVRGNVRETAGASVTFISSGITLAVDVEYDLALVHDRSSGDLLLYVNTVEEASALGLVPTRHNFGLYEIGAPADSWVTDCAVWDRVLDASELPGTIPPPTEIIEYIDGAVLTGTVGNAVSQTINAPATRAVGDLLLLHVSDEDGAAVRAAPAGYRLVRASTASTAILAYVFARIATNTSADNATMACTGDYIMRLTVWRNVDDNLNTIQTTIFEPAVGSPSAAVIDIDTDATIATTAMTARDYNCVAVHLISCSEARTFTDSLGYDVVYQSTFSDISSAMFAHQVGHAKGAVASNTITVDGTPNVRMVAVSILLRPIKATRPTVLLGSVTPGGTSSTTATYPTGIAAGDQLYLFISIPQGNVTVPADWQLIEEIIGSSNYIRVYRRSTNALGTESGTSISISGARLQSSLVAVRGDGRYVKARAFVSDGNCNVPVPVCEEDHISMLGVVSSQAAAALTLNAPNPGDGHCMACKVFDWNAGSSGLFNSLGLYRSDSNSGDVGTMTLQDAGGGNDIHHIVAMYLFGATAVGTGPTCTVSRQSSSTSDPHTAGSVTFDIVFSEAVTGFTANDVELHGTAAWNNPSIGNGLTLTGSGDTYALTITGLTQSGTISCTVPADCCAAADDLAPNQRSNTVTLSWLLVPTVTAGGEANSATTGTTLSVAAGVDFAVDDWMVIVTSADNAGASGAGSVQTCADAAGNSYPMRVSGTMNADSIPNNGITCAVFAGPVTSPLTAAQLVTISYSPSTPHRTIQVIRVRPDPGADLVYVMGDSATNTSNAISVSTPGACAIGDFVIGAIARESPNLPSADSDTTGGSWSGSSFEGTAQIGGIRQYKVTNAVAVQTYNSGGSTSNEQAIVIAVLRQT